MKRKEGKEEKEELFEEEESKFKIWKWDRG
jgi:hypothetical protein